jgi:TorA maturation chaperone TorD
MAVSEEMKIVLKGRAYNYVLFQSIFGGEPTRESIEAACGEATRQSLELFVTDGLFATDGELSYSSALLAATTVMDVMRDCSEEAIEDLQSEYTRLYLGPMELKAPPWESIYVSKKRQLFEESTLRVRNFYRTQGFLPVEYPRVADDHIALECALMAQLGDRASNACSAGDTETIKVALEASGQFLEEHLLVWLPDYVADLVKIDRADFYPIMAQLALEYMRIDRLLMNELISELQDVRG